MMMCCCCPVAGFDGGAWTAVTACCNGMVTKDLVADISQIDQCKVVFAGYTPGVCGGSAINFPSGDWPTIKDWIEAGGRFWLNLEHNSCPDDKVNIDAFLIAMGSSITWGFTDDNAFWECTPGSANISQGGVLFDTNRASRIDGGTSLWLSNGVVTSAVEAIGDGFIFVNGDSDGFRGTGGPISRCDFKRRLWEYGDSDVV
jgi:hypothetical protein